MTDSNATELLPCPFCGGEAKLSHYETFDNDEWAVECMGVCEIQPATCLFFTKEQAIEAWNTRTPEQAIAATLGSEREKALEELVQDWQALYEYPDYGDCVRLRKRMRALGIEVIEE